MQPPDTSLASRHLLARPLTRRRFMHLSGGAVVVSILAACRVEDEPVYYPTATSEAVAGGTPGSATPEVPQASADELARFLALSRALTGFDDLENTDLANIYLAHLGAEGDRLDDLYAAAGINEDGSTGTTLEQLEAAGVFDDEQLRALADEITINWYSGKYDLSADEQAVATYIDALAWPATGYRLTGPSSCTGATGVWADAPAA